MNRFEIPRDLHSRLSILAFAIIYVFSLYTAFSYIPYLYHYAPVPCVPIQFVERDCHEIYARLQLKYTYVINIHRRHVKGFVSNDSINNATYSCGPVLNCASSPCANELEIGRKYWCSMPIKHNDKIYISSCYGATISTELGVTIVIILEMLVLSICCIYLIYRRLTITTNKVCNLEYQYV
jgi:hypothetical protein